MTEGDLLEHIFERLCRANSGEEIFGADEVAQWPESALEVLVKSGLLGRAEPARVIECDGCERNCFMPVHVRPAEGSRPARAFISCDKPEDVGRVPVELGRLSAMAKSRAGCSRTRWPGCWASPTRRMKTASANAGYWDG